MANRGPYDIGPFRTLTEFHFGKKPRFIVIEIGMREGNASGVVSTPDACSATAISPEYPGPCIFGIGQYVTGISLGYDSPGGFTITPPTTNVIRTYYDRSGELMAGTPPGADAIEFQGIPAGEAATFPAWLFFTEDHVAWDITSMGGNHYSGIVMQGGDVIKFATSAEMVMWGTPIVSPPICYGSEIGGPGTEGAEANFCEVEDMITVNLNIANVSCEYKNKTYIGTGAAIKTAGIDLEQDARPTLYVLLERQDMIGDPVQ